MRDERRLARRAARGDRAAFAAIFRRHQQDLYRYCVAILGNGHDAEEALQNTMVKALGALPGERREIELKPWLYRVAHNESIDLRRRKRPSEPLVEDAPAPGADLAQSAADRGRVRDLLADIGELPERQRGALVMRELADLDFEQIGVALETSPAAARQVLCEARRSLQQMNEGREMHCDAVTLILSEHDGRVRRRRDVRAHLRDCAECRRFAASIGERRETLAAISPLPAVAAAAIAKGALSGAAGSGAPAASTGAAGIAGGATAKAASVATTLKVATGVVAVVAVGAAAVDHRQLITGEPAADTTPAGSIQGAAHPSGTAPAAKRAKASAARLPRPRANHLARPARPGHAGPRRAVARRAAPGTAGTAAAPTSQPGGGGDAAAGTPGAAAPGRSSAKSAVHAVPPTRPQSHAHPAHPALPGNATKPSRPAHPGPGAHPGQAHAPAQPTKPQPPAAPEAAAAPPGEAPGAQPPRLESSPTPAPTPAVEPRPAPPAAPIEAAAGAGNAPEPAAPPGTTAPTQKREVEAGG